MKAWQLKRTADLNLEKHPLERAELDRPHPGSSDLLVKVSCCGICHTELDEIEGRTPPPVFPVVPGHQVIGKVADAGSAVTRFRQGDRVGIGWIYSACGVCVFCKSGRENLCEEFKGTGRDANGGYAEYMVVNEKFACPIPPLFSDREAAPLLCAGAIGYRSLRLAALQDGEVLGFIGFGASAHLVLKTAGHLFPHSKIIVFARSREEQKFALSLGATWAGGLADDPSFLAHTIIDTTPAWLPVMTALSHLQPGGRLIINAIRKEERDKNELLNLDYARHLWKEKEIKSVANITTKDIEDFLALAAEIPIRPAIQVYSFEQANEALLDLRYKHAEGAKVLLI